MNKTPARSSKGWSGNEHNKQGVDMRNPERIEFLNHVITLTQDPWHDIALVHYDSRCVLRETYPHNTARVVKLNEAKHVVWLRHLEQQRDELKTFHENF